MDTQANAYMAYMAWMANADPVSPSDAGYAAYQREVEIQDKFRDVLAGLDAYLREQEQTRKEKEAQRLKELEEERLRQKMNDLYARIATARSKVCMGYEGAEKELSALNNELMLLLMFH